MQMRLTEGEGLGALVIHAVVILCVIAAATTLRALGHLDDATCSTLFGGALGYATGVGVSRHSNGASSG